MALRTGSAVVVLLACATSPVRGAEPGAKAIGVGATQARPGEQGSRWAVIIGVNDYQKVPKLRYCVADARLLYDTLAKRAGFDRQRMLLLTDDVPSFSNMPTRGNILKHLADFLSFPEAQDTVLVFFSGHGFRDDEGRGYLAPIDADRRNLALKCVPIAEVKRLIGACKARQKVLILDTCHSGTAKGGGVDKAIAVGSARLVEQVAGKGFVTLASCGPDQESHESPKLGHGVFTYFLADGLTGKADRDRDGWVDFDELYRHAWQRTRLWVYQEKKLKQEPLKDVRVQGVMVLARVGAVPPPSPITNSIGMTLVYIKPGSFLMGSPPGKPKGCEDQRPQHRVAITKGFYMGAFEVTQEQYRKVMGTNPSELKKGGTHPVETVSWDDAVAFCKKLSAREKKTYRLPTEAEWEYGCRAGTTTPYAFGDTISTDLANYDGDSPGGRKGVDRQCTTPAGSFRPNAWGLYDMHANVYEWCQDWYSPRYYARSPKADPRGPRGGLKRTIRGGAWNGFADMCTSPWRAYGRPSARVSSIGFRVVMSPAQ